MLVVAGRSGVVTLAQSLRGTVAFDVTSPSCCSLFFVNATATTEIYTLSLHDALPISNDAQSIRQHAARKRAKGANRVVVRDRKSTRLNSSHRCMSYAVFCLTKTTG